MSMLRGMPVVAHAEVADLALQRTHQIVTRMLAGRPDILAALVTNRIYLIIIGKTFGFGRKMKRGRFQRRD